METRLTGSRTDWSLSRSSTDTARQSAEGHRSEGRVDVLIKGRMFLKQQNQTNNVSVGCMLFVDLLSLIYNLSNLIKSDAD